MSPYAQRGRLMRLNKRLRASNSRTESRIRELTYLDGTDCWSIRDRTLSAAIVFQLIEVVNVSPIKRKG